MPETAPDRTATLLAQLRADLDAMTWWMGAPTESRQVKDARSTLAVLAAEVDLLRGERDQLRTLLTYFQKELEARDA